MADPIFLSPYSYLTPVLAFAAVLALMPAARLIALRLGYVDEPGGRKRHDSPVPPIGGLVVFPVFALFAYGAQGVHGKDVFFLLAMGGLLLTGAVDDFRPLPAWFKFFMQIAVALLVVIPGGAMLSDLGNLFGLGDFELGYAALPFSLAAVVLLINAVNLMDGLDGLAAGEGLIALAWICAGAIFAGQMQAAMPAMALIGALAGFLVYNLRHPWRAKASVFLGDAGSLALGLSLAWFAIHMARPPAAALEPISVAWVLALPIMDTCAQFYRRVRAGRHPFSPDRAHFHHHFIHAGFAVARAVALILSLVFLLGGAGVVAIVLGVPPFLLTLGWIGLLAAHIIFSRRPGYYVLWLSRLRGGDAA